jgi:hypothetical protein
MPRSESLTPFTAWPQLNTFFVPVSGLALSDVILDHHLLACVQCDNLLIDRTMVASHGVRIAPSCRKRIPRHGRCILYTVSQLFHRDTLSVATNIPFPTSLSRGAYPLSILQFLYVQCKTRKGMCNSHSRLA